VEDRPPGGEGFCVVGLGNPGGEYESTRHNVGFHVVDVLAARLDVDIRRTEFRALTARATLGRSMVLLMEPQTYMNASGRSVADALAATGIPPARLIAIYDDLDLPLGRIRVRAGGGAGGHRGVASLIAELGTADFPRVRVGIGRPAPGREVIDHVLSPFEPAELEAAASAIAEAADAALTIIESGVVAAMQKANGR
jgi:PTH1 family peptidyl-tRNA hydrolase